MICSGCVTSEIGRFMKIIKIIFFSLLALSLIVSTGIFIFFETFDTDQYLLKITNKASLALGRPVSIGHVGLGFSSRGITLDAGPLTIADDLDFTAQPFIKIDRVRISLDLKPLILQRKIHITDILLQSPQIHFIRSLEGNINARSIGQASRSAVEAVSPVPSDPTEHSSLFVIASKAKQSFNSKQTINIKSIRIQDASISFIDQNQSMPLDIWLSNINANLNDFSLSKPFRLSFDASPLVFKSISPQLPDSPIFKHITGVVQLNMAHLELGTSGNVEASGDIIITDGIIKNLNIINTVLIHTLGVIRGMDRIKDKLGAGDTIVEKAEAKFSFHDKVVYLDDSVIKTNIFEFTARGSVDQGLNTDMQTMLHLNTDISTALVNDLEGLKSLCDDSKRIAIGASLKGVIPHLKYKPNKDFRKKSKKALIEEGGNILGVLLGGGQASTQGPDAPSQTSGKKIKKNFKNIFKNFLK
jgi:AsmA family